MTVSLPSGTVTFLFTDIEGSTRRVAAVGDQAYGELLAAETGLVLGAVRAEGGVPFGSEGDAHFAAFASAAAGVRAAVAAQRAIAAHPWPDEPLRVRMGLHSGEAQVVGDDYLGFEVHRAARVASTAHGGQVVVSEATRLLAGEPGEGIAFRDLGEHRLKDLARPERVYQVEAPDLGRDFPALRSLDAVPNNLPPQLTSFVGRAELAAAGSLLDQTRLLTLTGPGGTGKTRLSLALAADCTERYPGGAWFVPLAAVRDPDLVASAIAGSLGVLAPTGTPLNRVIDHLRDRIALLVLDNFEQVVAGAPVVGEILRAAPKVTVLASSRAPLRVAGEQEFPVPPLALAPDGATDLETIGASEAVQLFVERAQAVRPDFRLTADNAPHVAEIVRRLDGLPLAIELAAARVRLLSPAAMAQRLEDRLGLLAGGGRDLPERQRTLRGAIDWSYDLLGDEDRRLFARLGVFAGGGELDTVESVCMLPGDAPPLDVVSGLEHLAEQSLVRIEVDDHGDVRFAMLETIREYALDRLDEAGELTGLRARHAGAYLAIVQSSSGEGQGTRDRATWLDTVSDDHDNVRAALDWYVETGDHGGAADLLHAVWRFWQMRSHLAEGRSRADTVLAMPGWDAAPPGARLHALEAAGGLAYWAGDMNRANLHYAAAVGEARRLGDDREIANALYNNFFATRPGVGMDGWIASLAYEGKPLIDEALEIWTRLGDEEGIAKGYWGLAEHHAYRQEYAETESYTTQALEIFEREGNPFWIAWTHFTRGFGRAASGRLPEACEDMGAALRDFQATRDVSGVALLLAAMSSILLLAGRRADGHAIGGAARLAIAQTGLHLAALWPGETFPMPDYQSADPAAAEALAEGETWSREEAVARALAAADAIAAGTLPPDGPA